MSSKPNIKLMEDNRDLNGLIKAMKDDDVFVRRSATKAIGRLGMKYNAENINTYNIRIALHDALNDKDHLVKKYANKTLLAPSFIRENFNGSAEKLESETSNNFKEEYDKKSISTGIVNPTPSKKPPKKSFKSGFMGWWDNRSSGSRALSLLGVCFLLGLILVAIVIISSPYNKTTTTTNPTSDITTASPQSTITSTANSTTPNSTSSNTQSNPPSTTADADNGYKDGYSIGYDDGLYGEDYWDGLSSTIPMSEAYRFGYKDGYKYGYADGKSGRSSQNL